MVLNVSSLLKTVKAVEDEHTRGTRAMEATVEAISQEIRAMQTPPPVGSQQVGPEDLIRVTMNVTAATAKAVAAGTSNLQADIVAAANLGRRAISDMLIVCRSVAWNCAETEELRVRTLEAGTAVGESYRELLNGILHNCSADDRMHLSRRVAKCVTDLVAMARLLKGSDWIDPEDPTVIAENELLGAAASIDAAAKKLASLRPRRQADVKIELDENMKFDEMILEAAKGIMAASAALVRAANAAQRELIDQGKVARRPLTSSDDGQWSEGLISAARLVAAATHSLVEAAQNLVRGVGTEEMLISTAKQVAASTAQLLIACKVKSNPNSEAGRRLQAAGNAVIKSTDNLVHAAQQGLEAEEEHSLKINTSMVDGMAQEINARSAVLRKEKELEEARQRLKHVRQAQRYAKNTQGFTTDESDTEYAYGTLNKSQNNTLGRGGAYYGSQSGDLPSSPSYYSGASGGQQKHHYTFASPQPQHFHHPGAVSPPPANYAPLDDANGDFPPPPPPLSTTISNMQTATSGHSFRSNPKLTANAVPRPYPGSPVAGGAGSNGFTSTTPTNPNYQHSFESSSIKTQNSSKSAPVVPPPPPQKPTVNRNLEACVQDLHDKTFGQGGVVQLTAGNAYPGQNYEGYTSSRYETRNFDKSANNSSNISSSEMALAQPLESSFSQMTLNTDGGKISIVDQQGSERLTSMTQRVMERKSFTTTTESRSETKTEKHSFRLE
ncbi:hypothetical protein ACLKA6_004787 [Drosophila palustris]